MYVPMDDVMREADKTLAAALAKLKEKYPRAEAVFVSGPPWEQILRVAKEKGSDLIVMGTHGRRGLSRIVMGSVAERIVRMSPIAVLTTGASAPPK
jgi:nucleotide-binding universal stress UspA family protein